MRDLTKYLSSVSETAVQFPTESYRRLW